MEQWSSLSIPDPPPDVDTAWWEKHLPIQRFTLSVARALRNRRVLLISGEPFRWRQRPRNGWGSVTAGRLRRGATHGGFHMVVEKDGGNILKTGAVLHFALREDGFYTLYSRAPVWLIRTKLVKPRSRRCRDVPSRRSEKGRCKRGKRRRPRASTETV